MWLADRVPTVMLTAAERVLGRLERAVRRARVRLAAREAARDPGLWKWAESARLRTSGATKQDLLERMHKELAHPLL